MAAIRVFAFLKPALAKPDVNYGFIAVKVQYFFDYKSPYAYLAEESAWALAEESGVEVEFLPYILQIPKYLGSAELDDSGQDTVGTRNDHQWRRVRYSYMDCRREANRRGMTIRGPKKIFDSKLAHIGFLFVSEQGDYRAYHDAVFEKFWRRELDIENIEALTGVMAAQGYDADRFPDYAATTGADKLAAIINDAEARGVFGVPSYLVDGELFWGKERLPLVREKLGL